MATYTAKSEGETMRTALIALAAMSLLAACASSTTGAMQIAPDTFRVTTSAHNFGGGLPGAQRQAIEGAQEKCASMDRELLLMNTSTGFSRPFYEFTATFRCLSKGDPELARPIYRQTPDVVIEDRRR
ncbi:MAG TPA: hypothetical protein VGJ74_16360 [Burkholderiales bacterium]